MNNGGVDLSSQYLAYNRLDVDYILVLSHNKTWNFISKSTLLLEFLQFPSSVFKVGFIRRNGEFYAIANQTPFGWCSVSFFGELDGLLKSGCYVL